MVFFGMSALGTLVFFVSEFGLLTVFPVVTVVGIWFESPLSVDIRSPSPSFFFGSANNMSNQVDENVAERMNTYGKLRHRLDIIDGLTDGRQIAGTDQIGVIAHG
ncbi:hypothetical protein JOC69_001802 [Heliobacterium gestii]|nr:hypothetical protein [Heliomicrobium gestii]